MERRKHRRSRLSLGVEDEKVEPSSALIRPEPGLSTFAAKRSEDKRLENSSVSESQNSTKIVPVKHR